MQATVIYKHALDNDERMSVFKRAFSHDSNNRNHSLSDEHGAEKSAKPISITLLSDTLLRYDTRCYFNVQSKADTSQLNLPHGTNNYNAENIKSKKKVKTNGYAQKYR